MTNQNNAAQAAQGAVKWANTPGAVEHFPATARAHINGLASLLLSKLRAPVADERAAMNQILYSIRQARIPGNDWRRELALIENTATAALASAPVAKPNRAPVDDGIFWSSKEIQRRQREEDEARAAYYHSRASAPVAGQAQPDGYAYRYQYGDGTVVRFNNGGEVNGCRPIESIPYWLGPAPQASASVRIGRATTKGGRVQSYAFQQTDLPDGEHALIVGAPQPSPVAWEAVAWQYFSTVDQAWCDCDAERVEVLRNAGLKVRPLYAAPASAETDWHAAREERDAALRANQQPADDLVASLRSMASVAPAAESEILLAAANALSAAQTGQVEREASESSLAPAMVPIKFIEPGKP